LNTDIQNLNKEQLLLAALRSQHKKSYYEFFKYFWEEVSAEEYVDNWHVRVLCDQLQEIGYRLKNREENPYDLIINIPPGSSKSSIVTILFPVWLWVIDPSLKILSGSYAAKLAMDQSVKSRDVIQSERFMQLYPEIKIKSDSNNKSHYKNTKLGERSTTSVGAGVTGFHYHAIVIDDPLKSPVSAFKVLEANEWHDTGLSSRTIRGKTSMTCKIIVMQRLHQNDLSAYLLAKGTAIKHICLPGELTKDTTPEFIKYYVDGLLDPIRLNRNNLNKFKLENREHGYAGQILQNPIPMEGGILKKNWFNVRPYTVEDINLIKDWYMFLDSAYTDKTENDPTGIIVCGVHENQLIIRHAEQKWLEFPELLSHIRVLSNQYNVRMTYVEPKSTGKSIVQTLRKEAGINIAELDPSSESKLTRVNAISDIVQSKKVTLMEGNWNNPFIEECTAFPLGKHDDMLDCLCYAINKLLQKKTKLIYGSF
jgi:predicted phage terminase large subunit-like protein